MLDVVGWVLGGVCIETQNLRGFFIDTRDEWHGHMHTYPRYISYILLRVRLNGRCRRDPHHYLRGQGSRPHGIPISNIQNPEPNGFLVLVLIPLNKQPRIQSAKPRIQNPTMNLCTRSYTERSDGVVMVSLLLLLLL